MDIPGTPFKNFNRYTGSLAAYGLGAGVDQYFGTTRTQTVQQRRNMPQTWEIAELTATRRSKKRKLRHNLKNAWKLLTAARAQITLRYESMNRWAEPGFGKNRIFWHNNTAATQTFLPMHFYRLGACIQDVNGIRTTPVNAIGHPVLTSTGITYSLVGVGQSAASNGTDSGGHIPYLSYSQGAVADPDYTAGRNAILQSVNMKLLCYGRASLPTRYKVFLCRIRDPDLTVDDINTSDGAQIAQMLRNVCASYTYNPAFLGAGTHQRGWQNIQVIMSRTFTIGSINSTEGSNTIPHMKEVSMYWQPNIMMRFDWDERTIVPPGQANSVAAQAGGLREIVAPTSQIYAVVMASSKYTSSAGAPTYVAADQPTYDIAWNIKWGISPT